MFVFVIERERSDPTWTDQRGNILSPPGLLSPGRSVEVRDVGDREG